MVQAYSALAAGGLLLMLLVMCPLREHWRRLEHMGDDHGGDAIDDLGDDSSQDGSVVPPRIGVLAVLGDIRARLRSGASLAAAFKPFAYDAMHATGGGDAAAPIAAAPDLARLRTILHSRARRKEENDEQVERAAVELDAACRLSESLGCETVRCLDAVIATYRRAATLQRLKREVMAMPKATAGLLSLLPAGTLLLGELLGAQPVLFLISSTGGLLCLAAGCCLYATGLLWVRALMSDAEPVPSDRRRTERRAAGDGYG